MIISGMFIFLVVISLIILMLIPAGIIKKQFDYLYWCAGLLFVWLIIGWGFMADAIPESWNEPVRIEGYKYFPFKEALYFEYDGKLYNDNDDRIYYDCPLTDSSVIYISEGFNIYGGVTTVKFIIKCK